MKKAGIKFGMILACALLLTACGSADKSDNQMASKGVWEDESMVFSTAVIVEGAPLYLGMNQEKFLNYFAEDSFSERETSSYITGVVCDAVSMDLQYVAAQDGGVLNNPLEVFGEEAILIASYHLGDKESKLAELIVEWRSGADEEKLLKSLVDTYGDDYITDTVFLAGYQEAYRWDEEDGTSIFLVPENEAVVEYVNYNRFGDDGYFDAGAVLIMAPTADVKDVTLQETEG